jgi:hypothetical protein
MIFRLIGAPSQRGSIASTQLAAQSPARPDCSAGTRNFSVFNSVVLRSSASVQSEPSHIQRESVKDGAGNSVRLSSRRVIIHSKGTQSMARIPGSPEGVALALFKTILKADPSVVNRPATQPIAAAMLDLFAECLSAASGECEKRLEQIFDRLERRERSALQ